MEDQKHAELERQSITFLRHPVADDGHCLYASTLVAKGKKTIVDIRDINHLRDQVACALPDGLEKQGIVDPVTIEAVLGQSLEGYQKAIQGNLWGGEIELSILPQALCAHVFVVSASGIKTYKYSGDHPSPSLCFIESTETHFNALELLENSGIDFLSESLASEVSVTIVDPDPPAFASSNEYPQQSLVEEKRRRNNSPVSHDDPFDFFDGHHSVRRTLFLNTSDGSSSDCEEMDADAACGFPPRT